MTRTSGRCNALIAALCTCAVAVLTDPALSQQRTPPSTTPPPDIEREAPPDPDADRESWSSVDPIESAAVDRMLESGDWAFRVLAIMRLDRYGGEQINERLETALADESWQVRSFAIRHAYRHGLSIDGSRFANEVDARVIRTALQHGVVVPDETVDTIARELLTGRTIDALLVGIEIATCSTDDKLRRNAARRVLNVVQNMNAQVAAVITRRLARALQIHPTPTNPRQWNQWASSVGRDYELPPLVLPPRASKPASLIAQIDVETFIKLRDYLGVLRQRDLELAICIDATNSMTPVIDAVKADVDSLILFLSDISSTLRLGVLAYRDHDNPGKLIEAHPFSTDLASIRNFLFGLQTPGGATYPEAVLDGINAARKFDWHEQAERELILVGDAPPHEKDESELARLLQYYRDNGFSVHAVHVPMQWPPGMLQGMTPAQAQERERFRQEYNLATERTFQDIANFGGGKLVELNGGSENELCRSVIKLTIEPEWWIYFDEFYDAYLDLCR